MSDPAVNPIAPSRGCAFGLVLAGLGWVAWFVALAVFVARCTSAST